MTLEGLRPFERDRGRQIQDQVAVAVAVCGGGAVAVAVAGLTKRFFDHIQKDFSINVWDYCIFA